MAKTENIYTIVKDKVLIDDMALDFEETVALLCETKNDLRNANNCLSQYAKEKRELEYQIDELKTYISELETELRVKEDLFTIKGAILEKTCDCARPSAEWYEQRYQSDCITINQLNVTIDTLVDKLAMLRKQVGL